MDAHIVKFVFLFFLIFIITTKKFVTSVKLNQHSSSAFKSKVEALGETLKNRVVALKNVPQQQLDLVFLVDSSDSVGADNFNSELKFVHKLLADHTVSYNKTRVALVTFSSRSSVIRHIDHITSPTIKNNKCKMLSKDMSNISYSGGGTYTLGAVMEARKILETGRINAARAVFLITDGYSNGGDPRLAATKLKSAGVQMFTFGILNGNVQELMDMASDPKSEHCYILDSFEEFEALARRALHQDLHVGDYEIQENILCNDLCKLPINGSGCCDIKAKCFCGTHIGHYECRCPAGYFGSGLINDCLPCPAGTYGETEGLIDVRGCQLCPEQRNISETGSTSINDCRCRHGYQLVDQVCVGIECIKLTPPTNGYFVNNNCSNEFNSACGIRCNPGYKAVGSSIRLCGENGEWSGLSTQCLIKHCPPLKLPRQGSVTCDFQDFRFQTRCNFTCEEGFALIGSKSRQCLAISSWDGIPAHCRSISCPLLTPLLNGSIIPSKCTQLKSRHGDTCNYSCNEGFILMGARKRQCNEKGKWTSADKKSICVDVTPPTIQCPNDVDVETDPNESFATVTWEQLTVNDNSGLQPAVISIPVILNNTYQFPIGSSIVTFVVEDGASNKANCSFIVNVTDHQSPIVDQCISPPTFLVTDLSISPVWEEPVFSDNSGQPITVTTYHDKNTTFVIGKTSVTYVATDTSGNNSTCILNITLQEDKCVFPTDLINGHANCSAASLDGTTCSLTCDEGYAFAFELPTSYLCTNNGSWTPSTDDNVKDCSVTSLPNEATENVIVTLQSENVPCGDAFFMHQVENKFQRKLDLKLDVYCHEDSATCDVNYMTAACENNIDEEDNDYYLLRRRRNIINGKTPRQLVAIRFQLNVSAQIDNGVEQNSSTKLFNIISSILNQMRKDAEKGELDLQMGNIHLTYNKFRIAKSGPALACPAGSVLRKTICVKCPVGTFYNIVSETCHGCSRGTYQFIEGQLSCLVCPNNTSTSSGQLAKSQTDCKAQCLPGAYSSDGLEPCQTCKRGFYNPGYAQINCIKCPGEMTTNRRGARNHTKCRELCEKNYVSQSGLKPCYECPPGYFQPERGMRSCFKCSQTNCSKSLIIKEIELPINDCFSVPCLNGGSCKLISFGYVCDCLFGFTGMQCESNINDCSNYPCKNGGQCIDDIGSFNCTCQPGFSGNMCEEDIDDCAFDPCLNDGKCLDLANDYVCDCPIIFTGKNCESSIDECVMNPCLNGGTCVQDIGGRRCICLDSFAGDDCQQKINNCDEKPCLNGGLCYEDAKDYFICQCQDGFSGPICQINIDECQSQPCINGGTCVDKVNSYSCDCLPGFVGHECQIKLSSNFVLRFQTSGISDYAQTEGFTSPLPQVSFCLWLKNNDSLNYGTSISYAVEDVDNSLTLTDTNGLVFYVNGEKVITDITANDGQWHIICVTWSALNGSWAIYKDGILSDYGSGLSVGREIPKGGSLVIGQDQDKVNGGFSQAEAFVGYLGWINFWDSILTENNIKTLMSTCGDYVGNVKSWSDFLSGVKGKVKLEEFHFCKGCGQPGEILNGKVTVNGSIARYYCNAGYKLLGKSERLCMIYGSWSIEKPECQRITCVFPGYIENGYMENNGFKFQDVIHYKCKVGYRLEGQQNRTCQNNGQWTASNPECVEIHCPFLTAPDNGYLNYTSLKEFATIATKVSFYCFEGFRLEGSPTSQCNADGFWDEDPPLCQPVYCTNPPTVPNGFVNNNSINEISIGEYITFECDPGYHASSTELGDSKMLCSEDSQWVGDVPLCVLLDCGQPPPFLNAVLKVNETTYGYLTNYSCMEGYKTNNWSLRCSENEKWTGEVSECLPVECSMLQSIRYGEFVVSSLKFNGIVTYSCMDGYALKGNTTRICLANGLWSDFPPICSRIICPNPPILENGKYIQEDEQYLPGLVITYNCNIGYQRIGPSKITCLDTGNWSDDFSICQILQCPTPLIISNGVYNGSITFVYNSNISYSCDRGYMLNGDTVRVCTENQTWSGEEPECQKVSCKSINNLKNGQIFFESFEYMSQVHYSCNKGFKLQGANVRTCLANGLWTDEEPECILNKCLPPKTFINGETITSDAIIQYKCDDGFILRGDSQQFCETSDSSAWSGTPASCHPIRCSSPEAGLNVNAKVTNLNFGAVVEYDCIDGYKPLSVPFVRKAYCQSDGSWSSASPNCEIKKCPKLSYLLNGKIMGASVDVGTILQFECDSGYKMVGDNNIHCHDNETWSGELPKCVPITCPWPIPQLLNGFLFPTGFAINDEVVYECNQGYEIVGGLKSRLCLADGTWTGDEPVCLPVDCGQPDISPDNVVSVNQTTFGSTAFYNCSEDFQLIGETNRTCLSNRTWSSSAPKCMSLHCNDVTCQKISCGPPPTVKNARFLNFTTTFVGGIVTYICDDGYMIEGNPSKQCDSSQKWLPYDYFPRCVLIECDALPYLQNGYYLYSSTEIYVGSTVTAECETDFNLSGDKVRMCGSTGDWTGNEAFCVRIECPNPPLVSHSSMEIDETIVGASIRYKCDKGYETSDNTVLTCMSNGYWNYEVPNCKAIQCPTPESIRNGTIIDLGHNFGNVIYLRCDIGHKMVNGSVERICQENGIWSGSGLICEPIICETLGTPFNSVVTIVESNSNKIANYVCNIGYKLIGNAQRTCLDDGRWSGRAPHCQIINCPAIENFENGWIVMSDLKETPFSFGTKISFICYSNYILNESISKPLECLSNGNWDRSIPACVRSKCDRWPLVADAIVIGNNSMAVESVIQYKCRQGFHLVGQPEHKCLDNGLWEGTAPKCVPVLCSQLPEIENATTKLSIPDGQSRFSFGATVTYTCKDGFELIGSAVLVCDAEGKWAGKWPTCNRTSCPAPPIIEHSTVQVENYEHLSRALYICEPGFILKSTTENPAIHCLSSGEWEKQINMSCGPMDCSALPVISNGRYENTNQSKYNYGSIIRFNCFKGFRPTSNGKLVVKCSNSGLWLSKMPRCRPVTCFSPEQPLNSVIYSDKSNIFGSTAKYSCLDGFKLDGNSERLCQHNGKWSGEVPRCLRFYCPELDSPTNGFVMVNGSGKYGDVARFRCEKGYILRGINESVCGSDGQWTTKSPTCRGSWIVTCNFPNFPSHTAVTDKMKVEYDIGEKILYHCQKGYADSKHVTGIATCQNDSTWSFTISNCQRVYCGPPVLDDKNVKLTEPSAFYFEDKLSYTCLHNTFPKDSLSEIVCKEDGSWSSTPTCEGLCPSPCLNGGVCIGPRKCRCTAGFLGDLCQKAFCGKPCQNGGVCIAYNRCKCEHGFSGKYCDQKA